MEEIRNAQGGGDARPDGDDTPPESLPPSPN
jgi:hypothetical protein